MVKEAEMETTSFEHEHKASTFAERAGARDSLAELASRLHSMSDEMQDFIRKRPGACLFGALALGYWVARLARRAR